MDRKHITVIRITYILAALFALSVVILSADRLFGEAAPAAALTDARDGGNAHSDPQGRFDIVVYIDPGHGGIDAGAVASGYMEKDIVLYTALMLYEMLAARSHSILPILSRRDDVFIHRHDRAAEGSRLADIIISIHCNFFTDPAVHGLEIYYYRNQALLDTRFDITSHDLAHTLQRNIIAATGARDRGARNTAAFGREFHLTTFSTVPAVIVEMGFMSNPAELALLASREYQYKMARGMYYGILELFGLSR